MPDSPTISREEVQFRIVATLITEIGQPTRQWYCSMVKDGVFVGAAVVSAPGCAHAHLELNQHKLNQGGELLWIEIDSDKYVPAEWCYRLLNREEAESMPCVDKETPHA